MVIGYYCQCHYHYKNYRYFAYPFATILMITLSLIAALLFGSMLFFVALVAPSVPKLLDAENAGRYLNDLFPRFYLWSIALSSIGIIVALYQRSAAVILMGIVLCGYIYARQFLNPKITLAREVWLSSDSPQDKSEFDKFHQHSVLVNTIQIMLLGVLLFVG